MSFEMVDAEERLAEADRHPLGRRRADHERTRQPRPGGRGEGVHVRKHDPGFLERVIEQQGQPAQVLARGGFGHHATVNPVQVDLRGDLAGEQFAVPAQDRDGGFVAGGFDGEDQRQMGRAG